MGTKRDAKCDSKPSYLWLRNNIFYYRVELPRVDGKRRYKRVSLHTSNFYEAREKIKIMENGGNWPFDEIRRLIRNLDFEPDADSNASFSPSDTMGLISTFRNAESYPDGIIAKILKICYLWVLLRSNIQKRY